MNQDDLKKMLSYCPETGNFTWKASSGSVMRGYPAGNNNGRGYLRMQIEGKQYLAHRLAFLYMIGRFPIEQADHINQVRDDNRWCNLREVTNDENQRNSTMFKNNKSGITGVCFEKARSAWSVLINVNGKAKRIGRYKDKFEAICARKSANNKYNFHANHGS